MSDPAELSCSQWTQWMESHQALAEVTGGEGGGAGLGRRQQVDC